MFNTKFFKRLEYKLGRFAIPNLMLAIVGAMALVYVLDMMFVARLGTTLSSYLAFNKWEICSGQVWRIITFILIPPDRSIVFIVFALYLWWLMGSALEERWGAFRFNLFYLVGIIGTIAAGLFVGGATNTYLNLSLFFAFALVYPEIELSLFFFLPVKVKYLAFADLLIFIYSFIVGSWITRAAILVAFLNVLLFFGSDAIYHIKRLKQNHDIKKRFKR